MKEYINTLIEQFDIAKVAKIMKQTKHKWYVGPTYDEIKKMDEDEPEVDHFKLYHTGKNSAKYMAIPTEQMIKERIIMLANECLDDLEHGDTNVKNGTGGLYVQLIDKGAEIKGFIEYAPVTTLL